MYPTSCSNRATALTRNTSGVTKREREFSEGLLSSQPKLKGGLFDFLRQARLSPPSAQKPANTGLTLSWCCPTDQPRHAAKAKASAFNGLGNQTLRLRTGCPARAVRHHAGNKRRRLFVSHHTQRGCSLHRPVTRVSLVTFAGSMERPQ